MISDLEIADVVLGAYEYDGTRYPWIRLWQGSDDDGVYVGLKRIGDVDLVVFRGSATVQDWERDFICAPHAICDHPRLGPVHAGFAMGMDAVAAHVIPSLGNRVIVAGHSLGAARALIFAGLMTAFKKAPGAVVVFGEPRPGFARLAELLASVPIRSYRNGDAHGHDLVTDVPVHIPLIAPFVHPREPLVDVCAPPAPSDAWGVFAWHHMGLYARGLTRSRMLASVQ